METANKFSRRFELRYGQGSMEVFEEMIHNPDYSLSDVGKYFGFSKQYAWDVYRKMSGGLYSEILGKKRLIRKQKRHDFCKKFKESSHLVEFKEKIEFLGFGCHITNGGRGYLFVVNGHKIVFKCTSAARMRGSKQYFHFGKPNNTVKGGYDFLVGLCKSPDESAYYVIPRDAMPNNGVSLQPEAGPNKSKYARFKEAWDLLIAK